MNILLFLYVTPIIISIVFVIRILSSTALRKEAGFNTVGDLITWCFCTLIPVFNIVVMCFTVDCVGGKTLRKIWDRPL